MWNFAWKDPPLLGILNQNVMEMSALGIDDLDQIEYDLVMAAKSVMQNAYNVYSSFFVGAAVYSGKGKIYSSTNMENASYGLTICAEAGAIQSAFSAGDYELLKIAIMGYGRDSEKDQPVTPCGRCRQLIYEAGLVNDKDIEVILCSGDLKKIHKTSISQLLPMPFSPDEKNLAEIRKRFTT